MSTAHTGRDRSDAVVFFGATGDLAFKQIFPALARLIGDEGWDLPIIGVARHGDVAMLKARWHRPRDPRRLPRTARQP
jgi:glucose-6-phosphate 1-dehydrogenase